MITYDQILKILYKSLNTINVNVHKLINNSNETIYNYLGGGQFFPCNPPKQSGIYIMFDINENRIVRVGKAEKSLSTRLNQHFTKEDKDYSILRKHIGRALLNKQNKCVKYWNTKGIKDLTLEKQITDYLIKNIIFCTIPLENLKEIRELEKFLIKNLSLCNKFHKVIFNKPIQSINWLGNFCTNNKVKSSGLWNHQHIIK